MISMRLILDTQICPEVELSAVIKLNIYRILQEQLNNILKHSQATKLDFWFQVNEFKLQMILQDDGKGFNPKHDGEESASII